MSLFSHLRFIELRIGSGKLGEKGNKALHELLSELPQDTIILIISSKLDTAIQRTKWFKCLDAKGISIQIWPVEPRQLVPWIQQRLQKMGLRASRDAVQILADRGEGNLLAIAQEIEKLRLLNVTNDFSVDDVLSSVSDSARFDIYGFVDTCLGGDVRRVVRMLDGLKSEGVEAILVLWALSREIRIMAQMAKQVASGAPVEQILNKFRVWPKRKSLVGASLRRHPADKWEYFLIQASNIDSTIKGVAASKVWDQLLQLCLGLAGLQLFEAADNLDDGR